eukprot:154008_1
MNPPQPCGSYQNHQRVPLPYQAGQSYQQSYPNIRIPFDCKWMYHMGMPQIPSYIPNLQIPINHNANNNPNHTLRETDVMPLIGTVNGQNVRNAYDCDVGVSGDHATVHKHTHRRFRKRNRPGKRERDESTEPSKKKRKKGKETEDTPQGFEMIFKEFQSKNYGIHSHSYYENFLREEVCDDDLESLSDIDLRGLVGKLGPRNRFKSFIKAFIKNKKAEKEAQKHAQVYEDSEDESEEDESEDDDDDVDANRQSN